MRARDNHQYDGCTARLKMMLVFVPMVCHLPCDPPPESCAIIHHDLLLLSISCSEHARILLHVKFLVSRWCSRCSAFITSIVVVFVF